MVDIIANDFFVKVNATFTALQVESGVVSKQYDSLRLLCTLLKTASSSKQESDGSMDEAFLFSEETISKGQFKASKAGLNVLMRGIDVDAVEQFRELLEYCDFGIRCSISERTAWIDGRYRRPSSCGSRVVTSPPMSAC